MPDLLFVHGCYETPGGCAGVARWLGMLSVMVETIFLDGCHEI